LSEPNDLRIRLDDSYSSIIDELRLSPFFPDLSWLILFCCTLGFAKGVKKPGRGSREVRLMVLLGHHGAFELYGALGLGDQDFDAYPDPLGEEHSVARAKLIEEYANGGLSIIKELYEGGKPISVVVPQLIANNFLGVKE
jgi:hypothetical protein